MDIRKEISFQRNVFSINKLIFRFRTPNGSRDRAVCIMTDVSEF
jgi:hypothetical protein